MMAALTSPGVRGDRRGARPATKLRGEVLPEAREAQAGPAGRGGGGSEAVGNHLQGASIGRAVSGGRYGPDKGKLERRWYEHGRHRWRFATLREFIGGYNGEIHDKLWLEMFETPMAAFQGKLPAEVRLGRHMRQAEGLGGEA